MLRILTRISKGIKIKAIGEDNFVFQQDGAPPHWALDVRAYLNYELANYWVSSDHKALISFKSRTCEILRILY